MSNPESPAQSVDPTEEAKLRAAKSAQWAVGGVMLTGIAFGFMVFFGAQVASGDKGSILGLGVYIPVLTAGLVVVAVNVINYVTAMYELWTATVLSLGNQANKQGSR